MYRPFPYEKPVQPVLIGKRRYRSTAEHLWGVWANVCHIPSSHEPYHYPVPGESTVYVPDFIWGARTEDGLIDVAVEVKPTEVTAHNISRAVEAMQMVGMPLLVICGRPTKGEYFVVVIPGRTHYGARRDVDYIFRQATDGRIHLYRRGSDMARDEFWFSGSPGAMEQAFRHVHDPKKPWRGGGGDQLALPGVAG